MPDLVIVGAGVSGLQALRECLAHGLDVVVLEKEARPGGKWSGHGIYDCVQIQQHKDDFFLPGVPWPEGTPSFPTRDCMVSATNRLIAECSLLPHIRCRAEVSSAVFDEGTGLWTTTTCDGAVWTSKWIAWAVGTLGVPHFPRQVSDALECFGGDVVHSHEYYRALSYEKQHVVVLGYGASSVEIAQDLARHSECASVTLVAPPKVQADGARSGQDWCLSRALPGEGSRFCSQGQQGDSATLEARNAMVREAMHARHPAYPECMHPALRPSGELEGKPAYPGMDGRPLGGRVIVSEGFLDCVADGRIRTLPGYLGGADATHVTVTHAGCADVRLRADAVIVATGYTPPTRAIAPVTTPAPADCETLYKGLWMADVPQAALIGHVYGFVAVPPFAGLQAKYLARVVRGAEPLPPRDEMLAWVAQVKERFLVTQRLTENDYFRELRAAALGEALVASAPSGAGPPTESIDGLSATPPVAVTGADAATALVATAAGEALAYIDCFWREASAWAGGSAHCLAVGAGSVAVANAIAKRLCGDLDEDSKAATTTMKGSTLTTQHVAATIGHWAAAADKSADLLVCHGGLDATPADAQFVEETLRVLKPGGHAVLLLREASDTAAAWRALLDSFERPSTASAADAAPRHRWRLVHKTAPLPHPEAGTCRVYVFRARTLRSLHGVKAQSSIASPCPSPPSASPPPTEAAESAADGVHQLFSYTSDYYVGMQGALEMGVQSLLLDMRQDAAQSHGAVCRAAVAPEVAVTRFNPCGTLPETGLLALGRPSAEAERHDWHAGVRAGRQLAQNYLGEMEGVLGDEMRLQAGNMIGHMVRVAVGTRAPE